MHTRQGIFKLSVLAVMAAGFVFGQTHSLVPDRTLVPRGQQVVMTAKISGNDDAGIIMNFVYDPAVVEFVSAEWTAEAEAVKNPITLDPIHAAPQYRITLNYRSNPGTIFDGDLATIVFNVPEGTEPGFKEDVVIYTGGNGTATENLPVDLTITSLYTAIPDTANMNEGPGSVLIPVLANDSDENGTVPHPNGEISAFDITSADGGTITQEGDQLRYTPPNDDYNGQDTFSYTGRDTVRDATDTTTVTVTVNAVDDPPVITRMFAVDVDARASEIDPADLNEEGTYQVGVEATDVDTLLENLSATAMVIEGATLSLADTVVGDGNVQFFFDFPVDYETVIHPSKDAGFVVEATVTDEVVPARGAVSDTIDLTVSDVDREPDGTVEVTVQNTAFTTEDVTASASAAAVTDPDGDALTLVYEWSQVGRRAFDDSPTLSAGRTTKGQTWQIASRVTSDPYQDGNILEHDGTTGAATIDIINTDPVLGDTDHYVFIRKEIPPVAGPEALIDLAASNPSDDDNDPLQYVVKALPGRGTLSYDAGNRAGGTVVDSPDTVLPLGVTAVYYTVDDETTEFYNGNDGPQADSFTFTVTDGDVPATAQRGESADIATVVLEYRENNPPEVIESGPQTAEDMDEGDTQAFSVVITDDNDPSGNGAMDRIAWYVSENDGADYELVQEDTPGRAALPSTYNFETDLDTIYNGIDGSPSEGQRPATKIFKIKVIGFDNQGGESEPLIWDVTVNDVDRDPPVPTIVLTPAEAFTDTDLTVEVTADPEDPDGDAITGYDFDWDATRAGETDTWPSSNFVKHQTIEAKVAATTNPYGTGDRVSANAAVATRTIKNSPPVATDDTAETDADSDVDIPVIEGDDVRVAAMDTDADGDDLTVASVTQPDKGIVSILAGSKMVNYDPNGEFVPLGPDEFEEVVFNYTVTDSDEIEEGQDTATVTVEVEGTNDQAVAEDQTVTIDIGQASDPITITVTDADINQTQTFLIPGSDDPGPGIVPALKAPEDGTVQFNNGRTLDSSNAEVIYTPQAGFAGVDTFEYAAWDGYGYSTVGTITVVVGTPLWYPFFDLVDYQAGLGQNQWYHVVLIDDLGNTVVDTSIYGTGMDPIDYFRAGSEGLLPGTHTLMFETWNPATGTYGGEGWGGQLIVSNYGYADFPTDLDVEGPLRGDGGPGRRTFLFRAMNGRGYVLNLYLNGELYRTFRSVFLPTPEGDLIPLNQLTELEVELEEAGNYEAEVRAFNPLDEEAEDGVGRAATPGPRWSNFDPFTVTFDGAGGDPDDPAGQVFPDGHVFVAPEGEIEITLQWNAIPDAVYYRLYHGAGNAAPMYNGENVGDTTSWRIVAPLGSHIWQVVGVNENGVGTWSRPYSYDVVRDAQAPMISRIYMARERGNTLYIEYHPKSRVAAKLNIQHYKTVGGQGWKVYRNVTVSDLRDDSFSVPGAEFQIGDYILVQAESAGGNATDYRVFVIE